MEVTQTHRTRLSRGRAGATGPESFKKGTTGVRGRIAEHISLAPAHGRGGLFKWAIEGRKGEGKMITLVERALMSSREFTGWSQTLDKEANPTCSSSPLDLIAPSGTGKPSK